MRTNADKCGRGEGVKKGVILCGRPLWTTPNLERVKLCCRLRVHCNLIITCLFNCEFGYNTVQGWLPLRDVPDTFFTRYTWISNSTRYWIPDNTG